MACKDDRRGAITASTMEDSLVGPIARSRNGTSSMTLSGTLHLVIVLQLQFSCLIDICS